MKTFLVTIALAFIAGCAKPDVWTHRVKAGRDMQTDRAECAALAGQANRCLMWNDLFRDCMCGRGYTQEGVICEK